MFDRLTRGVPGPNLRGKTIYLRPPELEDWPAWARLRAESREFLTPWEPTWMPEALSRVTFRRRLRRYSREARDDVGYAMFIFSAADNTLLGGVTLSNVRRGVTQSATIGYWIGKRFARRGLMSEALPLVMDWAFGELGLHRLEAACLPDNRASQSLLRKCGFGEEGFARDYLLIDGRWRDHLLFAIVENDPRPSPEKGR